MTLSARRYALLLLAVLGLAVALRVGAVAASAGGWFDTDSHHYVRLAGDILAGTPTAERSNGYPLLIAALALVLPHGVLALALVSLNVALSAATVALAGDIGRRVAGPVAGVLAALGVAVWPNQLNYVRYLLTEAPAGFCVALAVWLLVRRRVGVGGAVGAGIALGLAVLLRASLGAVVPVVLGALLAFRAGWRPVAGVAAGALLVGALNLALLASGTVAPPRHTGPNLLMSVQSSSTEGIEFSVDGFTEAERAAPLATYLRFAAEQPGTFVRQRLSALWELWGPWPARGDPEAPRSPLVRLLIGLRFALILLAAAGLWRHRRDRRAWLLAAPILAVTLVHVAFFAVPRFTFVAEPLAVVLAAWFAVDLAGLGKNAPRGEPVSPR